MTQTLELLNRHRAEIERSPVSWLDTPLPCDLIKPADRIFNLNWSPENSLTVDSTAINTSELTILHYPKAKERLNWWINQISHQLKPEQRLWIVGENKGGIKSLPKRLPDLTVNKLDSARHCSLFEVTVTSHYNPQDAHWFSFDYDQLTGYALPGVFSAGRLDKGTEVLLSALPELTGNVLEFGSGCGILTAALARQPAVDHVDAVECDLLAVQSTQRTLIENRLTHKAEVLWSDGTAQLAAQRYDVIVTNPPFHQGLRTAYAPTEAFFAQAQHWLKPGGRFIWVINEFLDYRSNLSSAFTRTEELTRQKGFKVEQTSLR